MSRYTEEGLGDLIPDLKVVSWNIELGYMSAQEKFMKWWTAWESGRLCGMIQEDLFISSPIAGRE